MTNPRISIVTPSFNQGVYIERTIRSVLLQEYDNLEYAVCDGGSTDATMEVVDRYRDQLAWVRSGPDAGQSDAIARGLSQSTGEIMGWLNSDDLLAPGALDAVVEAFERYPRVDVLYSHRVAVDADDRVLYYWILPPHSNYLMARWDLIPQETCFWRRRVWEAVGGVDPSYHFAMDYDLFTRFMTHGRFKRLDRFLGAFRIHPSSKTSSQLQTVGAQEADRVRNARGLRFGAWSAPLSRMFCRMVSVHGEDFANSKGTKPGCLAGIGYDYNDVWNGRLKQVQGLESAVNAAELRG
ncbi:MAG: glycosyltransferase family 2 protein [Planctomycetota bacterium]